MSQKERLIERQANSSEDTGTKTFGELNFGEANVGDARRTMRLVRIADTIVRHPGGSLPKKKGTPAELEALYHLMNCDQVNHEKVLAPHFALTRKKIAAHDGFVLALHDTTELDYTTRESLTDRGQISNGSHQGWLCDNTLIVDPVQRYVMRLANQILHGRPITEKKETVAEKCNREDRESLLWMQGVKSLPSDRKIVDVCVAVPTRSSSLNTKSTAGELLLCDLLMIVQYVA
jgi:hypothetical protein